MASTNDVHDALIELVLTAHYHEEVTPEEGGEPVETDVPYFKEAWKKMPEKIPMGTKNAVVVEKAQSPEFSSSNCAAATTEKMEFWVTILTKGKLNQAQTDNNDITDTVKKILISNSKLNDTCIGSKVLNIYNGEITDVEAKKMVAVSRIFIIAETGVF